MDLLSTISEPSGLLLLGAALLGVSLLVRRVILWANHGLNRNPKTNLQTIETPLK